MCPSQEFDCVYVFILAQTGGRCSQPNSRPPHWARDSLYGSVFPANSHLPVKNLLTPPMTGKGGNVCQSVCTSLYGWMDEVMYMMANPQSQFFSQTKISISCASCRFNHICMRVYTCICKNNKNSDHIPAPRLLRFYYQIPQLFASLF